METREGIFFARNYLARPDILKIICMPVKSINTMEAKQTCGFNFFLLAAEECKCPCNDVTLKAVVGVLVFIIVGLIIYIVWLHKKGTTICLFCVIARCILSHYGAQLSYFLFLRYCWQTKVNCSSPV